MIARILQDASLQLDILYNEDCLEGMQRIPDGSVDMILCDLPYGKLECSWDCPIDLDRLWVEYKRCLSPSGNVVLTGVQPFTARLVLSNLAMFKYSLVWRKSRTSFFAHVNYRPLSDHEDIVVFSWGGTVKNAKRKATYNPEGIKGIRKQRTGRAEFAMKPGRSRDRSYVQTGTGYPRTVLEFASVPSPSHPTQKPVALFEYLIRTYTNEGETVLDSCVGSGTTSIACMNTNRHYIGFEKDPGYFAIAQKRIADHKPQLSLTA
jgi:site-specific DNA-methyltransferase (adenine-specific)